MVQQAEAWQKRLEIMQNAYKDLLVVRSSVIPQPVQLSWDFQPEEAEGQPISHIAGEAIPLVY